MASVEGGYRPPIEDTYGQFRADVKELDLTILPDSEVRARINIIRDDITSDSEKTVARQEVIASMLRVIPHVLEEVRIPGVRPEELVGQSFETLERCIVNFDGTQRNATNGELIPFSTYYFDSLRKTLRNARTVERPADSFHVTEEAKSYAGFMVRAWNIAAQNKGGTPSTAQWKEALEWLVEQRTTQDSRMRKLHGQFDTIETHELRKPYNRSGEFWEGGHAEETEDNWENRIPDTSEEADVPRQALKGALAIEMGKLLETLPDDERQAIEIRFGIEGNDQVTFVALGEALGIPAIDARRLVDRGLRKLRHPIRAKLVRDFLDDVL